MQHTSKTNGARCSSISFAQNMKCNHALMQGARVAVAVAPTHKVSNYVSSATQVCQNQNAFLSVTILNALAIQTLSTILSHLHLPNEYVEYGVSQVITSNYRATLRFLGACWQQGAGNELAIRRIQYLCAARQVACDVIWPHDSLLCLYIASISYNISRRIIRIISIITYVH